ncbi:MAG: O-antigen ligase family protein [Patescibacteria group bacterium]
MKKIIHWISWAVAGILFVLPWQSRWIFGAVSLAGEHTEYGIMSIFITEFLVFTALLLAVIFARKISDQHQFPVRLGAIFCIAIIAGAAFADRELLSFVLTLHILSAYGLFILLILERVSIRVICLAFVAGLIPSIVLGMIQVFSGVSPESSWLGLATRSAAQLGDAVFTVDGERSLRAYGTFSHPNIFGGYLSIGVFVLWYALAQYRTKFAPKMYVLLGTFGTAALLFGLFLTGSRSAILGFCVGLVVMIFARVVKSRIWRTVGILGILLFVIIGSLFASFALTDVVAGLRGGGVHEERSLTERVALYEEFVPFIKATNIFVGHGVGSYVLSYADFDPGKPAYDYQPIHNGFLLMFAETGILGLLAALCFAGTIVYKYLGQLPNVRALYALGMGSVLLIVACYDHYLWSSWAGLALVAFVLGFMVRFEEE